MSDSPNFLLFGWSIGRSLLSVRTPRPSGSGVWDHAEFAPILGHLRDRGTSALPELVPDIREYLDTASTARPDTLCRNEALAYWINVYNAGALLLAAEVMSTDSGSVLRIPGGFSRPFLRVDGEHLSLDAVEHAKVRRFGDPRIHAALVCGSVSCPTLRAEPYRGSNLDETLDAQLRSLLAGGAVVVDRSVGRLSLSKIFQWYGADFTRPHRMPTLLPAGGQTVLTSLGPWLDDAIADWASETSPTVEFLPYDWGVACTVR